MCPMSISTAADIPSIRDRDLTAKEPYRIGEVIWGSVLRAWSALTLSQMVWVSVNIPGDPPITYWPAIINERSVGSDAKLVNRNSPPTPHQLANTTPHYVWQVSLLAANDKPHVKEDRLLPWLAYTPPVALFDIPLTNDESVAFVFDRVRPSSCDSVLLFVCLLTLWDLRQPGFPSAPCCETSRPYHMFVQSSEWIWSPCLIRVYRPSHRSRSLCRWPPTWSTTLSVCLPPVGD
jgi:hypothetical protein